MAEAGLILKEHFLLLSEVVGLVTAEWHCLPDGKAKVGKVWPTFGLNGTGCTQEETNILPVCNSGGEAICGALGKGHIHLISVCNLRKNTSIVNIHPILAIKWVELATLTYTLMTYMRY